MEPKVLPLHITKPKRALPTCSGDAFAAHDDDEEIPMETKVVPPHKTMPMRARPTFSGDAAPRAPRESSLPAAKKTVGKLYTDVELIPQGALTCWWL